MESKTFVALTDEQLVLLAWAMEAYYAASIPAVSDNKLYWQVRVLRDKIRAHALPAWNRMTEDYE